MTKKAGNQKPNDDVARISPVPAPGILPLPGTTTDPIPGLATPCGRWRDRFRQRLSNLEGSKRIQPYMVRAVERAEVCIGEIQQTAGYCGPIAATQATLGARFAEYAEYFLDHANPETKEGRSDIQLARSLADTSRLNLEGALKTAHSIANARPPASLDPLAGYMDPPESEPT